MTLTHEQKVARNAIADELHRRDPSRSYLDCVREAVATFQRPRKPAKPQKPTKKPNDAVVSEAVRETVTRVVTETLGRMAAPSAADSRPLHEISDEELTGRLTESYAAAAQAQATARAQVREAEALTADNAPDGEALRKMSDDELFSHLGGVMGEEADRLRPPAGAIPSPFWSAQ